MAYPIILYSNVLTLATPTATDTASGSDVRFLCDYRAYTTWEAASAGVKYVTVNCGSAQPVDALGIITHNLATDGIDVSVESSANGSDWTERFAAWGPTYDRAFLATFTQASAQYWRIKFAAGSAAPYVGEAFLGARMTFPKAPDIPFTSYTEQVEAEQVIGKAGHILGTTVRYKGLKLNPQWSQLTKAWIDSDFKVFWDWHASDLKPFFWAPDLTNLSSDVFFCTVAPSMGYTVPLRSLTYANTVQLNMVAVKESVLTPAASPTYVPLSVAATVAAGDYLSGAESLTEGDEYATITNASLTGDYVPNLTPSWNTTYYLTNRANGSFTVYFNTPAPSGGVLYWSVIV